MILTDTLINFLQEIINFPDFKLSTSALQQQIHHLLFLVNITDCCSDLNFVIDEHAKLLGAIESGETSWENVDYLGQWQSQILNNAIFSEEIERTNDLDTSGDIEEKDDDNKLMLMISDVKLIDSGVNLSDQVDHDENIVSNDGETSEYLNSIVRKRKSRRKCRKIASSSVHEHFKKIKIFHPVTKIPSAGSICKHCNVLFASRISSNLKRHLQSYHMEAFNEVENKDNNWKPGDPLPSKHLIIKEDNSEKNLDIRNTKRLIRATVHDHFLKAKVIHPKSKKLIDGRHCIHCDNKFTSKISTNLNRHLEMKHPEVYKEVKRQDDQNSAVVIVDDDNDANKKEYCDICNYKSSSKLKLRIHVRRKHEENPLKEVCPICNKKYVLLHHLRSKHPIFFEELKLRDAAYSFLAQNGKQLGEKLEDKDEDVYTQTS